MWRSRSRSASGNGRKRGLARQKCVCCWPLSVFLRLMKSAATVPALLCVMSQTTHTVPLPTSLASRVQEAGEL